MKLIVGLGNPGKKYHETRHNLGFMALDRLAHDWGFAFSKSTRFQAEVAEISHETHDKLFFLKPQTFMNLSGQSVWPVVSFYKLNPEDVLVIHDDIDLPCGRTRFARSGQSGGHNGIKSIIASLGSTDFHRLKLGVGRSGAAEKAVVDHVLDKFSDTEIKKITATLDVVSAAVGVYLAKGITEAMNQFNGAAQTPT